MHLVVGATGYLGGAIARGLLERGERVRILARPGSDWRPLQEAGAEVAFGDLKHPDTLAPALHGARGVVTTATASARGGEDTIRTVDLEGTAALIDAAREAREMDRFLFVSAYGFQEDDEVLLARAKASNERRLRESGLPYTILQPVPFMESWIGFLLGQQLQAGGPVHLSGDGEEPTGFVAIGDVAALALASLEDERARDRSLPLSADTRTMREVVALVEETTGRPIDVRWVPAGEPVPGMPPVIVELAALLLSRDMAPDTTDVIREFGLQPRSVAAFVRDTFAG